MLPPRSWILPKVNRVSNINSGSHQWLSANRSLVVDGCYFARSIPFFPVERTCDLGEVARLRSAASTRISWTAVFLKAHGLVAAQTAPLRQCYLKWPWPHIFEHDHNVGMLAMNRQFAEGDRLCWGRFDDPETKSLVEIQKSLDAFQNEPVDHIFKRQVFFSRLPWPVRRLIWWLNLNVFVSKRAKRMGTFSMSSLAGQGAINRFHFTVLSTSLTYAPVDATGKCLVTLICDHRVIDGSLAAAALIKLEETLNGVIADELRSLAQRRTAA